MLDKMNPDLGTPQGPGIITWPPESLEGVNVFVLADLDRVRVLPDGYLTEDPKTGAKHEQWTPVFKGEPEFLQGTPLKRPALVYSKKRERESYYPVALEPSEPEAA